MTRGVGGGVCTCRRLGKTNIEVTARRVLRDPVWLVVRVAPRLVISAATGRRMAGLGPSGADRLDARSLLNTARRLYRPGKQHSSDATTPPLSRPRPICAGRF